LKWLKYYFDGKLLFAHHKNDSFMHINNMNKFLLAVIFCFCSISVMAQQNLLGYEDLTYIITNNQRQVGDFMESKGYSVLKTKKTGNQKYTLRLSANTQSDIEIRWDARRVYIYIATDELQQVNLLIQSISPYLLSQEETSGVMNYKVKDLGNIYLMTNDKVPYNPVRKDYDIRIVSDKNITTYN
jgi:hypothetical protein